jgi:glyoxylase-like metal-dependent hydrolase (beta-lactamase superfamily II)
MEQTIFTYHLGEFEVDMLVENRGQGGTAILLDADPALVKRYIPSGSYESQVNVFLIRAGGKNILVDTGFGGAIMQLMGSLGVGINDVDAVLITHMHGDHIMGLQRDGKALFPRAQVFLAEQEKNFWLNTNAAGEAASAALEPYGSRVSVFSPVELAADFPKNTKNSELFPGIIPIAAFGHTPGHTIYQVESSGARILITGDMVHAQDIQFPVPGISVTYDTDPAAAAASRGEILRYAAANSIPIGGMHLVYPAIGTVAAKNGGYLFTPLLAHREI